MNKLERYNPMMDCCETVSWAEDAQERIDYLEDLLLDTLKDLYSPSCKFKKSTAIKLMKYVEDNNINMHDY